MGLWFRLNQSKLKLLSHQFKRCYVQHPYSSLNYTTKTSNSCSLDNPIWDVLRRPSCERPTDLCNNVRFFATSYQSKTNKEEKDSGGPRLNEQITARFIRLVTDEGHGVVPMREALEQARKLKLDLVEVSGNVDPPVCKIMDFHKEKYKRQAKEKDRSKSKSEVTLRKGDCKEVRFSAKCEQKDLKMKADSVIRLMERGYRVKCMAQGSPKRGGRASLKKGYGDEDLTEEEIAERRLQEEEEAKELRALLSRLTTLMGDEFIVESGPRLEKKQAYVIVRHAKFGPSKKGGAKKMKDVKMVGNAQPTANHSDPVASSSMVGKDCAESAMETEDEILSDEDNLPEEKYDNGKSSWSVHSADDFDDVFALATDDKDHSIKDRQRSSGPPKVDCSQLPRKQVQDSKYSDQVPSSSAFSFKTENRYRPQPSLGAENRYKPQHSFETENRYNKPQHPLGTENRYKRSEPRQQFPPITSRDSMGMNKMDSFRFEPQLSPRSGHQQSELNATSSMGGNKQVPTDSSAFRNIKLPHEMLKQRSSSNGTGSSASGFGIFGSPKPSTLGKQAEANNNEENRYKSGRDLNRGIAANPKFPGSKVDGGQRAGDEAGGQARWGMFSRDGSDVDSSRISK